MADPTSEAAGFISFVATLREQLSPAVFARIVQALPPETRVLVDKPPMAMTWIDRSHFDSLMELVWRVAVAENGDAMTDLSRRQMRRDMNTIYKVLMHVASTHSVLKKASTIFSTYTKVGRMSSKELDRLNAEIIIDELVGATSAWWAFYRGAIWGVLDAAGTTGSKVVIKEGGGTNQRTVYDVTWS